MKNELLIRKILWQAYSKITHHFSVETIVVLVQNKLEISSRENWRPNANYFEAN